MAHRKEAGAVPYLIPTDIKDVKRGIPLEVFYQRIAKLGFSQTAIFLDACFSKIEGGRSTLDVMNPTSLGKGRTVVFSATDRREVAHKYELENHGLFTYFLLKGIQQKTDNITFGELSDIIGKSVSKVAKQEKPTEQNPKTEPSKDIEDEWRLLGF